MAGFLREGCRHPHHRSSARKVHSRALVEYVPVGLPPQSLLDQLVSDMQRHLEEMEKVRAVMLDAYPCLSPSRVGGRGAGNGKQLGGDDDDEDDSSSYEFSVDVAGFSPDELAVKLEGRKLTVSGKHEQKAEEADGCVSHEYREVRKELRLPADANLDAVACTFSPEAEILRIEAPRLTLPPAPERTIPISFCKTPDVAPLGQEAVGSLPEAKEAPPASGAKEAPPASGAKEAPPASPEAGAVAAPQ